MSTRILVFSDLHLHPFREFATYENGENSRLTETAERLGGVLALAQDVCADVIVHPGDFYDNKTHIEVTALTLARKTLEHFSEVQTPLIMCSGTHDIGRNQRSTLISLEGAYPKLHIDQTVDGGQYSFVAVPSPVGNESLLDNVKQRIHGISKTALKTRYILVTHGFVFGPHFKTPGDTEEGLPEDFLLDTFALSIIGHYHNPSRHHYIDPKTKRAILIPGSVIPHNFGNPETGKAWTVTLKDNGDIQFTVHEWDHPRFVTYNYPIQRPVFNAEDYYRVLLPPGTEPSFPEGTRVIVVQKDETEARTRVEDISVGDSPEELVGKYVEYFKKENDYLPLKASALVSIGTALVTSKDKELSDEDTEKIEEIFDGAD